MKELSFIVKPIHPLIAKDEDILCLTFTDIQMAQEAVEHISSMITRKNKLKVEEDKNVSINFQFK